MIATNAAPSVRPGGLVTVAFLKARVDEGHDHLDLFWPLLIDVVSTFGSRSFSTSEVQESLAQRHGMAIPQDTVATLLKRATKRAVLVREAGRYHVSFKSPLPRSTVSAEKQAIEASQLRFGDALRAHAVKRGLALATPDAALELFFRFLEDAQVAILLGNAPDTGTAGNATIREQAICAEFIHDVARDDMAMQAVLRGMLEGLVIYHAAFLPALNTANRSFKDLRAIFDTVLVRQALGYEGDAMRVLVRETIDLLKASGVQCLVLDKTMHEIQRILSMYQDKLGSSDGRASLRPVPMARHFLSQRFSPADVREMSALLETEVTAAGFRVQTAPPRTREYTAGELALANRFADPIRKDPLEPRVQHDVDCVAAVLTLRANHRSSTVEDARAIFVTSSPLVIHNARLWWEEDEQESGIPPIAHIRALTNVAWLKKPSTCANYKVRELVALCAAAMRPTQDTWKRFLRHLDALKQSQKLTSDEVVAIVVSAMSDRLLREAESEEDDPADIDSVTLDDVVARVKASYGADADSRVQAVRTEYERRLADIEARAQENTAQVTTKAKEEVETVTSEYKQRLTALEERERAEAETRRRRELAIDGWARRWAYRLSRTLQWLLIVPVSAGSLSLLLGHPRHTGWIGVLIGLAVAITILLEVSGIFKHVSELRDTLEVKLTRRLREWMTRQQPELAAQHSEAI